MTTTSATTYTYGQSAPATEKWVAAAIEILDNTPATATLAPPFLGQYHSFF
jgi:hypothetical protein